ncbi:aldehyde dehydrogenase family protein [Nakamurella lactea]|uniref:aldehyde dehydrogenase family protein n=1 Tax=Nakamurella lactea TaxID=459515 RepID=UPI00048F00B7|nr:aldehyde dehydrogenase family protein [Nakamurella lactea]
MERHGAYLNGVWVVATELVPNVNPSDVTDVIGLFADADQELLDQAVVAARSAQPGWAAQSPQVRADLLDRVGAAIDADATALGTLLAREEGKTLPEAIGEVRRAAQIFRFHAGEALRLVGDFQDSIRAGVSVTHVREPVGVVGVITPWNFPISIPAWKCAPALAHGNTVILKPAELVPASAIALAEILDRAGCPPGVFNVVTGRGSNIGAHLVSHPDIDAVTFTGSEEVGVSIAAATAGRLVRVQLELGGKNPLVVMADADLDLAVDCAVDGAFMSTGQRCTATSRIYVEEPIYQIFVDRLLARTESLRIGHALDPATQIGPVVDGRQLAHVVDRIEGARALTDVQVHGGRHVRAATDGHFLTPAVVIGAGNECEINRSETFGPVASVQSVADLDQAIKRANDTAYGLVAGICTSSLRAATEFRRRADTGIVTVNLPTAGVDPHVAFGGRKRSGFGPKEQGRYAQEFYTQVKTAYERA